MKRFWIVALVGALVLSACGGPGDIEVNQPWARAAMQGENSAIYFNIYNSSKQADEITGASSDVAEAVEIHLSAMGENGMMTMTKQESVLLDAGKKVQFAPGGLHVMLIGLTRDLKAGDRFQVTLHFKDHADITLDVIVQEMEGMNMGG